MCYDEGKLMEYLDGEACAEEHAAIGAHVGGCAACSSSLERLRADRAFASEALDPLRPGADVVPMPAPRPLSSRLDPTRRLGWVRVASAAAAVLVVASFGFAPVRGAAADLLRVFRVQKVQTISLTEQDLLQVTQALSKGSGHVDLESLGEAWVDGAAREPKKVTLAQAQAAVDFPIALPKGVEGTPTITLQPAATVKFRLKVDAINEALRYYGSERTFPREVDGKVFEIKMPAIVVAAYGDREGRLVSKDPDGESFAGVVAVGQARSPELIVPDGVDPAELRDVLLGLPLLPKSVRDQLAAVDDWQSTLLVPNVQGTARDVNINGVPAVVLSPEGPARDARRKMGDIPESATVIWNVGGVVRAVGGAIDEKTAIGLAKSCMR